MKNSSDKTQIELLAYLSQLNQDAIIAETLEGIIFSWSPAAELLYGYSRDEILGKHISIIIPDDLHHKEDYIIGQIKKGDQILKYETIRICKDRSKKHVHITAVPIYDDNNNILGVSKLDHDITKIKNMEDLAKLQELALQGMSVGIWDWNIVTNELFWSQRFKEIAGITDKDFSASFSDFESRLHPEDKNRTITLLMAHVNERKSYNVEYRLRNKDDHYVWIHAMGQAQWDENGKPLRMVGSVLDITKNKLEEERFRLVIESSPIAKVMINEAREIVLINAQTEKMFGYAKDELIGKKIEYLMPEQYRANHPDHFKNYSKNPETLNSGSRTMARGHNLHGLHKNGTEFPLEVNLTPIKAEEGLLVLGAIIDLTQSKEAERKINELNKTLEYKVARRTAELELANKELDDFAFAVSHDLKAPLRVIDNASQWLEEDLKEHLTKDNLENMNLLRKRVKRMEKLLDDMLEFSRVGRTDDKNFGKKITGSEMIDDIIEILSPPRKFTIKVTPDFANTSLFRMPLQQILLNLISNAIKHHHKKDGHIEVGLEDLDKDYYTFKVKDDGPGIAKEFHEKIFAMFQTLKPRDQVEGSGIGLAMVRKYIHIYGGNIKIHSSEGEGCTFIFTWPKQQIIRRDA